LFFKGLINNLIVLNDLDDVNKVNKYVNGRSDNYWRDSLNHFANPRQRGCFIREGILCYFN